MIVKVKQQKNKKKLIKFVILIAIVVSMIAYYFYMSNKYEEQSIQLMQKNEQSLQEKRARDIERIIYDEAQIAVDLLLQEKVRTVRIIGTKLYIAADPDTSLDALMVRYGVGALIKASENDIKIAINLNQIVESKYDGQNL